MSRFRPDSEIRLLAQARQPTGEISPLLAEYLQVGLEMAATTGGRVDPTVGHATAAILPPVDGQSSASNPSAAIVPGWQSVGLVSTTLTMQQGTLLDLGASAKAHAADRCAAMVATHYDCAVLVNLGGDVSTSSVSEDHSWQVLVRDAPGEPSCQIELAAQAGVATSSTLHRRGMTGAQQFASHIVDPATGQGVAPFWRTVTVAADTCVRANALSTAAIVVGQDAIALLTEAGWPARLVARDGTVSRLVDWPA